MDIAQLRTLIHVAELGSASKAADRLGIAQPALSRQIRMIEAELKAPLFIRHGRGMTLTDLGRKILASANAILEEVDAIRRLAEEGSTSFSGRVRLGMTPTVAEIMTVPLARRVKQEHPHISLCISSAFSGHILDWLKRDLLDCCVSYDADGRGAVRTHPILTENLLLVGNGQHGLSMKRPVAFSTLTHEPLVLPSPLHGLRQIVDACAARAGIELSPQLEADSLSSMIDLVREGFGYAILPLAPIYSRVASGELSAAPLSDPEPTRRVVMTYPADRPVSPATRYVGETFATIAAELIEQGVWAGHLIPGSKLRGR
ncbi:LysR family transcriptional regulator [Sphingobium subterraneum]|uniref:DNA-binding transcriptional LysR family regulator n=1 Tax=Sphingobium subterraneum TaxID=627688 RepID=A0A841J2Z7_9SPHN|nr:LysR substrate-binding domain-containing protein [Sphingobium subterraneum]MBB6122985.1 DNA-binding transcriptional LysR family regulator [Sphingobium subterraneum]